MAFADRNFIFDEDSGSQSHHYYEGIFNVNIWRRFSI